MAGPVVNEERTLPERTERLALPAGRSWRNPALGQAADALAAMADMCVHPLVVLPLFIAGLTDSTVTIGLAIALVVAATALGYPLAIALEHRALLQFGGLMSALGLRALAFFLLAGAGLTIGANQARYLGITLIVLSAAALFGGFAAPLRLELASGASPESPLSSLRGRWVFISALAAIGGALLARLVLARADLRFPGPFVQIFLLAGVILTLATLCAVLMQLPTRASPPDGRGLLAQLSTYVDLLINNLAYGRLVFFRLLYAAGAIADPFYIVYATRELGATWRTAGAYLVTYAVARAAAAPLWRALGLQAGNRMVLQLVTFVRLLAPITALTLPPLLGSATLRDRLPGGGATNLVAFGVVFAAAGMASAGLDLAAPVIQASITTPRERGAAAAVMHLALGGAALGALLGGLIADRLGFAFLFIITLVVGLGTLLSGGLVDEPALVIMRPPPSERPAPRRRR